MSPLASSSHRIKKIQFLDRADVPVFCQSNDGPCPLLSIANVLSLRNQLQVPRQWTEISTASLMQLVADYLLDVVGQQAENDPNLQANIQGCLNQLQKLSTGVDVNIRFDNHLGFEFTDETTVFDLLGIRLVHGWLIDPRDTVTARALGNKTYNQVVELIVAADEAKEAARTASTDQKQTQQQQNQENVSVAAAGHQTDLLLLDDIADVLSPTDTSSQNPSVVHVDTVKGNTQVDNLIALDMVAVIPPQPEQQGSAGIDSTSQSTSMPAESTTGACDVPRPPPDEAPHPPPPSPPPPSSSKDGQEAHPHEVTQHEGDQRSEDSAQLVLPAHHDEREAAGPADSIGILQATQNHPSVSTDLSTTQHSTLEAASNECAGKHEYINQSTHVDAPSPVIALQQSSLDVSHVGSAGAAAQTRAAPEAAVTDMFAGLSIYTDPTGTDHGASRAVASAAPTGTAPGTQNQVSTRPQPAPVAATTSSVSCTSKQDRASLKQEADILRDFLECNRTQLTVYGLSVLNDMPEHTVAVFYRNYHFNCMFKYGSSLYLLISDQGYLNVHEVVWERLDTVDGDTQLCGADFQPYRPRHGALSDPGGVRVNMDALAAIPAEALAGMSEADAAAVAEAAGLLNPVDHGHTRHVGHENNAVVPYTGGASVPAAQYQHQPQHTVHGRETASDAAHGSLAMGMGTGYHQADNTSHEGPPQAYVDEDADLAFAIQLQEEEEESARAAERREREAAAATAQRQQHSQYQQGGQQQQQGGYVPPHYAGSGQQFSGQHLQYGGAPQQQYGYGGAATQQQYQQAGYGYPQQPPQGRPAPTQAAAAASSGPADKPSDWTDKCNIM